MDIADIDAALVVDGYSTHSLEGARSFAIPSKPVLVPAIAVVYESHVIKAAEQVNIAHTVHGDGGIQFAVIGDIPDWILHIKIDLAILMKTDNILLEIEQYSQDAAIRSSGSQRSGCR